MKKFRIGLVGITGYTGMELARLLASHPHMELTMACSRTESGKRLGDFYPFLEKLPGSDVMISVYNPDRAKELCDVVFLAVPHGKAMDMLAELHQRGIKVVDLTTYMATPATGRVLGEWGADVACGAAQTLGIPLGFGGPYVGFLACSKEHVRKLPGRIVGATTDVDGKRAFVLTLQAREQHIRREKANSNICSNQALCAFAAGVYMAAMGEKGLKQCARLCTSKAHYFASELEKIGCTLKYKGEFFHEFVTEVECPNCRRKILDALEAEGILGGAEVEGGILWCVTELVSKSQLDKAVAIVKEVL